MVKEREADLKKPGEELLKGKERTLGFRHGPTQPKWPKKEINGEDLIKSRFISRTEIDVESRYNDLFGVFCLKRRYETFSLRVIEPVENAL